MPSVSRTLWSVMSTPMPRSLRNRMMLWMSSTAIGSTPANGSSSRMKRGSVASARAISTRRRSPPDSEIAECSRRCAMCRSFSSCVEPLLDRRRLVQALQLEDRLHVLLDRQAAENRSFLRQVGEAQARAAVDRQVREVACRRDGSRRRRAAPGRRSCRSRWSCRRRWGRAARPPRRCCTSSETSLTTVRDL